MLENNTIDQQLAVMLHLMMERARGVESHLQPYIALLPASFTTPVFYTEKELALLHGTALFEATRAKQQQLITDFEYLKPAAAALWRAAGLQGEPSLLDFAWAYSIFWSRALLIPDTNESLPSPGSGTKSEVFRPLTAAMIPGLDLCNHATESGVDVLHASWTIYGAPTLNTDAVTLMARQSDVAKCKKLATDKGAVEVRINYGDKGNEELLFLYGFSIRDNPHETLMLHFPLFKKEKQESSVLEARIKILTDNDLSPQHFLQRKDLTAYKNTAERQSRWIWGKRTDSSLPSGSVGPFPLETIKTLEVLVMTDKEVMDFTSGAEDSGAVDGEFSLRTRAIAALVEYLNKKLCEMETATGKIDQDIDMLNTVMSHNARACIQYRLSQKEIIRDYLKVASDLLVASHR